MSSSQAIIEFNPDLSKLSKNEKEVLKLLVEAGKLIAPIYLEQENSKYPGANFYPHDATKKEIESAANKDPEILSPYTVVERVNGKLVAIPYHVKYQKQLVLISDKLKQASQLTDDKNFANFLKIRSESLLSGEYAKVVESRLKTSSYILDISLGPIFQHNDRLFFKKTSYHCWVGILNDADTNKFNNYKDVTLNVVRKGLNPKERIDNNEKVKAKVLDVLLFSGVMERTRFVGVHLPVDVSVIEKYGSELTLFTQPNDLRVKEQIIPTFEKIFSKEFKDGFSRQDLIRGYLRGVALHELAHSYLYYKNASSRLLDLFPVIDELTATLLGLRLSGILLVKDRITNKQMESMLLTFLCRSFYHKTHNSSSDNLMSNYAQGGSLFINFLLENGAIKIAGDTVVPNFMKIFLSLHDLTDVLEALLAKGTYKEAKAFINKYI